MITKKDIRVENGFLIINGDKYPLDGQSPEAIMQIVKDNSDTTPTENSDAPITSGGVFAALGEGSLKVAEVSGGVGCTTSDAKAIGGYKTGGTEAVSLSSFTGYPTGKTVVGWSLAAFGTGGTVLAVVRVANGYVFLNAAYSGSFTVNGFVFYTE